MRIEPNASSPRFNCSLHLERPAVAGVDHAQLARADCIERCRGRARAALGCPTCVGSLVGDDDDAVGVEDRRRR